LALCLAIFYVLDGQAPTPILQVASTLIALIYLWPGFFVQSLTNSHGGILLMAPFTVLLYAFAFAFVIAWRKTTR
jgi:hypothetical protein